MTQRNLVRICWFGREDGDRTRVAFQPGDFKSPVYTNSTTSLEQLTGKPTFREISVSREHIRPPHIVANDNHQPCLATGFEPMFPARRGRPSS